MFQVLLFIEAEENHPLNQTPARSTCRCFLFCASKMPGFGEELEFCTGIIGNEVRLLLTNHSRLGRPIKNYNFRRILCNPSLDLPSLSCDTSNISFYDHLQESGRCPKGLQIATRDALSTLSTLHFYPSYPLYEDTIESVFNSLGCNILV